MLFDNIPDSKVHEANMGPIWGRQAPGGLNVGPWTLLSGIYIMLCPTLKCLDIVGATKAQWIGHIICCSRQLSVTLLWFRDQGGVCAEWTSKHVHIRNDSQRYVPFGSCWRSEMVRSCVNTLCDITGKSFKLFKANFIIQSQQKSYLKVSMNEHGNYQVTCFLFSVDFV